MDAIRRRLRGVPLRQRLVAITVLFVALGLLVTSLVTNLVLDRYLTGRIDQQLHENAQRFGGQQGRPPGGGPPGNGPTLPSPVFVEFYDTEGTPTRILKDPRLDTAEQPDLSGLDSEELSRRDGEPYTVDSEDGTHQWRVLVDEHESGRAVAIAIDSTDVRNTMHRLLLLEVAIALAVLLLLGVAAYVVVRSSLRPLVQVERTAEEIASGHLDARVPELDPRTEVGGLSVALNVMLGQIEEAVRNREAAADAAAASEERMRRFVADASHELRTPLTSIRGFAELYGQGAATDRETVDRFMNRIEHEAARMTDLVEDLLLLARMDQQRPLTFAPVDLREIATDLADDARAMQPDRPIVTSAEAGAVIVRADEARLRQVVANLVRNALVHTPPKTPVTISVGIDDGFGTLAVRDRGPGIAEADVARVFERFYRGESSRARTTGGNGLGLSIVHAIVDGHGGDVRVDSVPGRGATFTVRIPLSD